MKSHYYRKTMLRAGIILSTAILALDGSAFASLDGWSTNFTAAKKEAAESKKDLLIYFSGSEWCIGCHFVDEQVFCKAPFKTKAVDTFVLLEVEYPFGRTKIAEEMKKPNQELTKKYAVMEYPSKEYPTILLCDAEGLPYAFTSFDGESPEQYISLLNELRGYKAKRDEAFASAGKVEGLAKAKALVAALDATKLNYRRLASFYSDIADQIKAADPKDETGFTKKFTADKRLAEYEDEMYRLDMYDDIRGMLAYLDKSIKEGGFETEQTQDMLKSRANCLYYMQKFDDALKAADEAKAFAPNSSKIGSINSLRKLIEDAKKKADAAPKNAEKPTEVTVDASWSINFAAAKQEAADSKKDLLIDFTGTDWCAWCIQLDKEVFQQGAFNAGVKDTFVLVKLDYPRDKTKQPEETQKQNKELLEKYAVKGFPTVLLCDAEGRPYAATSYQKGGPEKYVSMLDELRGQKIKRDEAFAAAEKVDGTAKAKVLMEALGAMNLPEDLVSNCYGDIVDQIKSADPNDETGFRKMTDAKKRMGEFNDAMQKMYSAKDMAGAIALVDKTIKEAGFTTDETQQLMLTRALTFCDAEKFDEALKAFDEAKAFAPEGKLAPKIDEWRVNITNFMNKNPKGAPKKNDNPASDTTDN